jgi:hypothetical protein
MIQQKSDPIDWREILVFVSLIFQGCGKELKWYAGVGVVKIQTKGETLRLESSTLVQPPDQ